MRLAAVHSQEPLSGQTILLDSDGDEVVAEQVKKSSRDRYAREYKDEKTRKPKSDTTKTQTDKTEETITLRGSLKHAKQTK